MEPVGLSCIIPLVINITFFDLFCDLQNFFHPFLQSDNRKKKSLLSSDDPVREVNDDNYESFVRGNKHFSSRDDEFGRWRGEPTYDTIIYVVLLVVAIVGAIVNLLVVLGVKLNRRWLFLPWLVFHLMAIMGKFLFNMGSFQNDVIRLRFDDLCHCNYDTVVTFPFKLPLPLVVKSDVI